eukprot:TRINITY_DN71100_c0_g1_i1.p1 TRINITY_DN71100_c0_g1~~TRINITY_DN71100_c0_g1_i1.p1  ORF type:complete len:412 (+),score=64.87 TRINITY_DN71100_c0_g1_i1:181-1416(+)
MTVNLPLLAASPWAILSRDDDDDSSLPTFPLSELRREHSMLLAESKAAEVRCRRSYGAASRARAANAEVLETTENEATKAGHEAEVAATRCRELRLLIESQQTGVTSFDAAAIEAADVVALRGAASAAAELGEVTEKARHVLAAELYEARIRQEHRTVERLRRDEAVASARLRQDEESTAVLRQELHSAETCFRSGRSTMMGGHPIGYDESMVADARRARDEAQAKLAQLRDPLQRGENEVAYLLTVAELADSWATSSREQMPHCAAQLRKSLCRLRGEVGAFRAVTEEGVRQKAEVEACIRVADAELWVERTIQRTSYSKAEASSRMAAEHSRLGNNLATATAEAQQLIAAYKLRTAHGAASAARATRLGPFVTSAFAAAEAPANSHLAAIFADVPEAVSAASSPSFARR